MKLIIAIIQPSRLEAVKTALTEVEVFRLTVVDVQGFGRQKGQTEVYRGREISVNLLRKVQLQIAVNEAFVEPTINAIIKGGRTGDSGQIGGGQIFGLPVAGCGAPLPLRPWPPPSLAPFLIEVLFLLLCRAGRALGPCRGSPAPRRRW